MRRIVFCVSLFIATSFQASAQDEYRYDVDLTKATNDKIQVELTTPKVNKQVTRFYFPAIVPGTYRMANYGRFISNLVALDAAGKQLPVHRSDSNTWQIRNATRLARITYTVDDTWDDKGKGRNNIYSMAGTNIEAGKNFVVNSPGFFGYLEGLRDKPFRLNFTKPANFYAATALVPVSSSATADAFVLSNIDELYDSPIMFSLPDTAVARIGDASVLVAVYSPNKKMRAATILRGIEPLLKATTRYLGGKLPVKKYAFIYYFNADQDPSINQGALEHNYSSFYAIGEAPPQEIMPLMIDISAHEFFHIVSPLLLSSKEIKVFNFQEPIMSRHLWLYEGSTEYASDHVQVKYGLNSVQQFLNKLSGKINNSRRLYNDTLAFTRLSKESTGKYSSQFNNVYEKGALISACLDLKLLALSSGTYGITQLKHDLTWKFGKDRYFEDDALFDVIASVTYPEIRGFFAKYVEQGNPIPYEEYFALAGVRLIPEKASQEISLGGIQTIVSDDGKITIGQRSQLNDFGKKMGYQRGDQLLALQGKALNPANMAAIVADVRANIQKGQLLTMSVIRKNNAGVVDTLLLSAPFEPTTVIQKNVLELMENASEAQVTIRKAWLSTPEKPLPAVANQEDVKDINSIMTTLYDVISGKAGPRNWERFRSMFYPGALMSAVHTAPNGQTNYQAFTFEDYISMNSPLFAKTDFFEKELGRKIQQYGNLAQVQSAYEFRLSENGKIEERGVNHVSLLQYQGRWWITQLSWETASPGNPIPAELMNK